MPCAATSDGPAAPPTLRLQRGGPFTIDVASTLGVAAGATVTLTGDGESIALDWGGPTILSVPATGSLTVEGLALEDGGMYNAGTLTVTDTTFTGDDGGRW